MKSALKIAAAKQAPPEVQKLADLKSAAETCSGLSQGQRPNRRELLRIADETGVDVALAALVSGEVNTMGIPASAAATQEHLG